MTRYDHIAAIYNPNSTNDARAKAENFRDQAKKRGYTVTLTPTDHPGHAIELAENICRKYRSPLLVSVSGDGGYNELVNGVMQATEKSSPSKPVIAIIAAGNANDHKRTTRGDTPLVELLDTDPKPLDLILLESGSLKRYAHSYIGLGITPKVGVELNRHELNFFREIMIVIHSFRTFKPFEIVVDGATKKYGSLVFANIHGMAKVLKLTKESSVRDGKFDIIKLPYHGTGRLLFDLVMMAIRARHAPEASKFTFTTTAKTPIQLDGEIEQLEKSQEVTVISVKNAVLSLY